MPEVSRFLGVVIQMYYSDHSRPHFHARYGEYRITVEIDSDWYVAHVDELRENWNRASNDEPLTGISPLE
jgi:hypothetical protein